MKLLKDRQTLQAVADLIEYAFNKRQSVMKDPLFLSRYEHADCYGTFQKERLSSLVMVNHFKVRLFSETIPMAGIGYVASYPEFRGKGGVSDVMREILHDLHQQQIPFAQLAPFSEPFYRQFGFERTIRQKLYHIPADQFRFFKSEAAGEVRRGNWQEMQQEIMTLHQRFIERDQLATVIREKWWWDRLDAYFPFRFYTVCDDPQGRACGYLIYRLEGSTFKIDELGYENVFALRKLLSYVKAHVSSFSDFTYAAPIHECLEDCFSEQAGITINQQPYMMSRIINFEQLLHSPSFEIDGRIIEVTEDAVCPWNKGQWRVQAGRVEKVSGKQADILGSIEAWTELIVGSLTIDQAVLLGKIEVRENKDTAIVKTGKTSFYDYY
ncbi:GNAT family acetyltransferase [Enterococcus florum]|uniref:GNAT family acetyltransferase n=1 Tax=Enterococcus florum TaxID=2480627 RepID=A0A4V0WPE1_9ENTE|nr:GNAT family N-acetyltransferase [Enterococcus florum]GCF93539.1 GNAT family acetyltransferase [Enterococcus florum]